MKRTFALSALAAVLIGIPMVPAGAADPAPATSPTVSQPAPCPQTRAERRAAMRAKAAERWKAADTNGDGTISKDEAQKGLPGIAERFDQVDTNHDGMLSQDELKTWHASMHGPRGGRGPNR